MIVWINGGFGSGKTLVAHELCRRLAKGWIADPEHVGFALRRMTPPGRRDEFQRSPAWRRALVDCLHEIDSEGDGVVIVPQTLLEPDHHTEIVEGLRERGHQIRHLTLIATSGTLARRLRSRGQGPRSWAYAQIDRVTALRDPQFAEHVATERRSIDEIVEEIAVRAGLNLVRGRQRAGLRHVAR